MSCDRIFRFSASALSNPRSRKTFPLPRIRFSFSFIAMLSCTCSDQARPGRSDLELELLEIRARHTTLHVEHFDADDFPGRIEVEDDSRLDLFRLDDIGFIEAQVERVDLLVVVHFHGLPLRRRSK